MNRASDAAIATVRTPKYYDGLAEAEGDVKLSHRYYTYPTEEGLVAGRDLNITFTIPRPAKDVWPIFKDFTLWQGSLDHYYSAVLGDLYSREDGGVAEESFYISTTPGGPPGPHPYAVVKVIPERLIVISQPVAKDGSNGGVSRGFHVFMLTEFDGTTLVTCLLNHAHRTRGVSEGDALEPLHKIARDGHRKWRDHFIPTLKRLVDEACGNPA